jgi:hypothetical protein
MEERKACDLLKLRFEEAGFDIEENRTFDEAGVRFDIDGFDTKARVGYEYVTAEAGDGWDVDGDVIAALEARRKKGELYILVVDEADAPDEGALGKKVDTFLAELRERGVLKDGDKSAKAAKPKASKPPPTPKAKPKASKKR